MEQVTGFVAQTTENSAIYLGHLARMTEWILTSTLVGCLSAQMPGFQQLNITFHYLHLLPEISVLCLCMTCFHTSPLSPSVWRKAASYCSRGPLPTNDVLTLWRKGSAATELCDRNCDSPGPRPGLCWHVTRQWHNQRLNHASAVVCPSFDQRWGKVADPVWNSHSCCEAAPNHHHPPHTHTHPRSNASVKTRAPCFILTRHQGSI